MVLDPSSQPRSVCVSYLVPVTPRRMDISIKKAEEKQIKHLQECMYYLMKYEHEMFDSTSDILWAKSKDCENYFRKKIKGRNSIVFVALHDDKIIGYISGEVKKRVVWKKFKLQGVLSDMVVLRKFRNKSIGSLLVGEFLKWAKGKGIQTIEVKAYSTNTDAHRFYKRHGFDVHDIILEKIL